MTEYLIEKNVPMPKGYGSKYPFEEMEIGDSFRVNGGRDATVRAATYKYNKENKNGAKLSCRKDGANAVRIWRVK